MVDSLGLLLVLDRVTWSGSEASEVLVSSSEVFDVSAHRHEVAIERRPHPIRKIVNRVLAAGRAPVERGMAHLLER
ncbi:hypothetical protein [Streptomyces asiaticus]|uniref:hypothetical protein n=1 Tax=Streptomyces asiaticus TaxID=114695 RepID=UPI0038080892